MVFDKSLTDLLQVPENAGEDIEISAAIVALILSASHDKDPRLNFEDLYHAITKFGCSSLLDPLNSLPHLLKSQNQSAKNIIALMSECSSAKEVLIAAQEAVERVESSLSFESDEQDDVEVEDQPEILPLPSQLVILVAMYASTIPRLKLRNKSALDTIRPLLSDLEMTIQITGGRCTKLEAQDLIASVAHLVKRAFEWVQDISIIQVDELSACVKIFQNLMDSTLAACAHYIDSFLATRNFERFFPRLTFSSSVKAGWEDGERVVSDALRAYTAIGIKPSDQVLSPSLGSMISLAHSPVEFPEPNSLLRPFLPIILTSIQTNNALDEALSLILTSLHPENKQLSDADLSPELVVPLTSLLSSLASTHPDPSIRHLTFRILSLILSSTAPELRLHVLTDLTTDNEFPQMRVAALGLVKEAVLEGLEISQGSKPNLFASSFFLRALGPVFLRSTPPDLFSSDPDLSVQDFQESTEPPRLVECLSLYYVLLRRDHQNQTGIRDCDIIADTEKYFLKPLRSALEKWMGDSVDPQVHMHDIMPLVSLKMSLERVDDTIAQLGLGLTSGSTTIETSFS